MLKQLSNAILGSADLMANVHSTKSRLKDPSHLEDKLFRKLSESKAKGRAFSISQKNLFWRINDLAGFRILHLHTQQIVPIDVGLRKVFEEYRFPLHEKPKARTWDDERRELFRAAGIRCIKSPKMYTSVHYVVQSNNVIRSTCEIQVRTLADELWGEVDHSMNYPKESPILACREQIKVLARLTSSCSRLVDSIYRSAGSRKIR
jgi:putative GTP pyrophosphokinase